MCGALQKDILFSFILDQLQDYTVSTGLAGSEQAVTGASIKGRGMLEETNIQLGARVQEDEIIVVEFSWDRKTEKVVLELK